jgi:toxin-antitoxin system PIN domain toxin
VKLVDANVLLYALDDTSVRHAGAKAWLDAALSGSEEVGFAWVVLLAVLRLTTKAAVFARPLRAAEAFDVIDGWLAQPCAVIVHPTTRHAALMRGFLQAAGTAGNLTTDAHIAALSVEYGAIIATYDADFSRFPGVSTLNPDNDR